MYNYKINIEDCLSELILYCLYYYIENQSFSISLLFILLVSYNLQEIIKDKKSDKMEFPVTRMRRLRKNQNIRTILTETKLNPEDFIYPIFIKEGLE